MANLSKLWDHLEERRVFLSRPNRTYSTCACCGYQMFHDVYNSFESAGLKFCDEECIWKYEEEGVNHLTN